MMDENGKKNNAAVIWMLIGAGLGVAAGAMAGRAQGSQGTAMCYGLLLGMAAGAGIGALIKRRGGNTPK
ncbi:hypothetical protein RWV98_06735 [Agathobaculum sp. NTUH-O15-33]|uniref:hypothetical protein n=1 Tax=Agathobaculum sp. NTUH-O15-33 TaxID=3079302 RepID=UPI00295871C7|nr:hypothetical protein [Agathobaculum sp. NTUH-O15-33]WNX85959.1 hypothetical protein RWV98_06735 [Agathobaculum sp. NTUH-O15-33]